MALEDVLKKFYVRRLERRHSRPLLQPKDVDHASIRRILVVRQHDQLGDFLVASPVFRALRARYPDARIVVVAREYFAGVARCVPFVDDVIAVPRGMAMHRRHAVDATTRDAGDAWDLAIVLNTVSHSLTSDLIAVRSGARYVLGPADGLLPGTTSNFLYNLRSPVSPEGSHQTDINLDIVRYLGIDTPDRSESIVVPDTARLAARDDLRRAGITGEKPAIGIHIGAGKPENRWPVDRFAALANRLMAEGQCVPVLFYGPMDTGLVPELERSLDKGIACFGPRDLLRLAGWFTACRAVVCNDTGVMHLAAATGTPVLALFGPTDPVLWLPQGKRHQAIRGAGGDVTRIEITAVIDALADMA